MKRTSWLISTAAVTALGLSACGGDAPDTDADGEAVAEVQTWRVALEEIEGSVQHRYAERFAELVEERLDNVEFVIYSYGELSPSFDEIYSQLQDGAVQFGFGSGFFGGVVPENDVFSLSFVLTDDEWLNTQILNAEGFLWSDDLQEAYRDRDVQLLSLVPEGWQVWAGNEEIRSVEDFEGVRIRVMDNRLLRETYSAYGADPTSVGYSDIYGALETGAIDANIQPVFAHQEMSFYEVQDYMIFGRHKPFIAAWMANRDFWDSLSDEEREAIREANEELVEYIHEAQVELNERRMDQILEARPEVEIIDIDEDTREAFREASMPVRDTYVDMAGERGGRILERLLEEVEAQQED
ncbi:TRAP-type C4-dicarboxylate transport system substrate-binding protein [Alkalispirillum mobile]|uniref:TRAP-type C4-dicarboxylate transport system substrate-binding protein n=1 Tax=Alkalispirillum mobile TaxID=85925 RepID=A0A498CEQ9_9GAMM|nr:TRAP transporter substrate-binding protein DctP [Alkalispirillum mobile]RLK50801.1 TRAP-type C4-dicarboxylate transport system substrate-binding protein [Alkalispirillum mobile]